jgi:erythromycin esterase
MTESVILPMKKRRAALGIAVSAALWSGCLPRMVQAEEQKHVLSQESSVLAASSDEADFLQWAKKYLVPLSRIEPGPPWDDLAPLGKIVGTASVVALGEGVHGAAEPLEFRNRVFQYLVENKGFTAIAIESGIVEGRAVNEYVHGGPGDLSVVLAQGISWTMDRLPQNRELIRWLRHYNADPQHTRKLAFYGFDIPGSPCNPSANRGPETAIVDVLKYLARVDNAAAAGFHARLDSLIESLRCEPGHTSDLPTYDQLTQIQRDTLTATIADLVTLLEREEAKYTASSTVGDYDWAYRAAIGARETDAYLRQIPVGWHARNESVTATSEAALWSMSGNVRDRAQADNLEWIVGRERSSGGVLIFAHRGHLYTAPTKADASGRLQFEPLGTYLRRRFGSHLLTIVNLIGKGDIAVGGYELCAGIEPLKQASPDSLDGLVGEVGTPRFLLDLRKAPTGVAGWLDQEHELGRGGDIDILQVRKAFDVLFYLETVTPACRAAL